jgi:hypothetical protein
MTRRYDSIVVDRWTHRARMRYPWPVEVLRLSRSRRHKTGARSWVARIKARKVDV